MPRRLNSSAASEAETKSDYAWAYSIVETGEGNQPAAHIGSMRILNVNRRATNEIDVALPFETDVQVLAAWYYIIGEDRAADFRYDPEVEGEDPARAWMGQYLRNHRAGTPQPVPDADQVRRAIPKIWGAEMNYDIRELVSLDEQRPGSPA